VKKYGDTAVQIAFGLRDAIDTVSDGWKFFTQKIKEGATWVERTFGVGGKGTLRTITKFVTLFLMAGAALTPILIGLAGLKFIVGGLISVFAGLGSVIAAAFWPVTLIVGGLLLAWQLLKRENESFWETSKRVWGDIKVWALDVWENSIRPLWEGIMEMIPTTEELGLMWSRTLERIREFGRVAVEVFTTVKSWVVDLWVNVVKPFYQGLLEGFIPALEDLRAAWIGIITNVKMVFGDLWEFIFGGLKEVEINWREVGRVIGAIIGAIATAVLTFVQYAIPVIASIAKAIWTVFKATWDVISWIITQISEGLAKVVMSFQEIFSGNIISGLARLGSAVLDFVLKPLRLIIEGALQLADALNIDIPAAGCQR
jgi:phage-related protein